jgi:hypothetical protein
MSSDARPILDLATLKAAVVVEIESSLARQLEYCEWKKFSFESSI